MTIIYSACALIVMSTFLLPVARKYPHAPWATITTVMLGVIQILFAVFSLVILHQIPEINESVPFTAIGTTLILCQLLGTIIICNTKTSSQIYTIITMALISGAITSLVLTSQIESSKIVQNPDEHIEQLNISNVIVEDFVWG